MEEKNTHAFVERLFTKEQQDPYSVCKWVQRAITVDGEESPVIFPEAWYQTAIDAFADVLKEGEHDLHQVIDRVVNIITKVGFERGYFLTEGEADAFHSELKYLLVTQRITFAKSIWKTVGVEDAPPHTRPVQQVQPISDLFMRAVEADGEWRAQEEPKQEGKARHVWQDVVRDVWKYSDTSIKFETICDDLAVVRTVQNGLAPKVDISTVKYVQKNGDVDIKELQHTATIAYVALDILTQYITVDTSEELDTLRYYRPVSLGLADVSPVLLSLGLAYDSDEAREITRSFYALVNGQAVLASIHYAQMLGAFVGCDRHTMAVGRVLRAQRDAIVAHQSHELSSAAKKLWSQVVKTYREKGIRNVRIGGLHDEVFMLQALGSENAHIMPLRSHTQEVEIPSGGKIKIVKEATTRALKTLDYTKGEATAVTSHIHDNVVGESIPGLKKDHAEVFKLSSEYVEPATFEMLAVITSFVGLGVANIFTLPEDATPRDVEKMLVTAWQLGIPKIQLAREGAKAQYAEPEAKEQEQPEEVAKVEEEKPVKAPRKAQKPAILPKMRASKTFAFCIDDVQCHLTVSESDTGVPMEILLNIQQSNAELLAMLSAWTQSVNVGLQHGIAISTYIQQALNMHFAPAGKTDDDEVPLVTSVIDYVVRRLALQYLTNDQRQVIHLGTNEEDIHKDQVRLIG